MRQKECTLRMRHQWDTHPGGWALQQEFSLSIHCWNYGGLWSSGPCKGRRVHNHTHISEGCVWAGGDRIEGGSSSPLPSCSQKGPMTLLHFTGNLGLDLYWIIRSCRFWSHQHKTTRPNQTINFSKVILCAERKSKTLHKKTKRYKKERKGEGLAKRL